MSDFDAEKGRVMASGWPSGDDNLLGMEMDVFFHLTTSDLLDADSVDVDSTQTDFDALIVGRCCPDEGLSVEDAAEEIEQIWLEALRYHYFESHEFGTEADMRVLHFVTQDAPNGMYVTGRIALPPPRQPLDE